MSNPKNPKGKSALAKKKRFAKAKKNFERIQEELTPFIKLKEIGRGYSTVGRWCENVSLCEK